MGLSSFAGVLPITRRQRYQRMDKKIKIQYLFDRLLENSITEAEFAELMSFIQNPDFEEDVKSMMDAKWEEIGQENTGDFSPEDSRRRLARIMDGAGILDREDQENKKSRMSPRLIRLVKRTGIAASFLLLISLGLIWWISSGEQLENLPDEAEIARAFHGKQVVHLPDGSSVILNEESQISYREDFGMETREVIFSGEGYFDIASDPDHPFVVRTGKITTTVLGTAFNMEAREDQSEVKVAVERGEVMVGDDQKVYDHILAEELLVVNTDTEKFEKKRADISSLVAWKMEFLILDDVTIEDAGALIGDYFGVKVELENEAMKNCKINASFLHRESLDQVLRVLCGVLQCEYSLEGQIVQIKGGRVCK